MESAIVQKVQQITGINLMLELESINDKIPLNTPFELNGVSVPCLRMAINDAVINYSGNHLNPHSVINLKGIYENLTGNKIVVSDLEDNKQAKLILFLNELQEKVSDSIKVTLNGQEYPCLKKVICIIKEGYINNPYSPYFQDRIRELFSLMS